MKTLPLFFKKLRVLPRKVETFLYKQKLPTLIAFTVLCLLVLTLTIFNLWWYGVFDDMADTFYRNETIDLDQTQHLRFREELYPDEKGVLKNYYLETAPKMSTEALVQWVVDHCTWDPIYESPSEYFEYIQQEEYERYNSIIVKELKSRHNVSRVLAKMYLDYPLFLRRRRYRCSYF